MKSANSILMLVGLFLVFTSCEPSITVTKDYVTNSNWGKSFNSKYKANCWVYKLKVPDSIGLKVVRGNFSFKDIENLYEFDTSYCYFKTHSKNKNIDTLFFNKPNKFYKWNPCDKIGYDKDYTVPVLQEFEKNTWYRLDKVKLDHYYFIYIDSFGNDYVFEKGPGSLAKFFPTPN